MVKLAISEISPHSLQSLTKVQCSVDGMFGVYREEPIIEDVAIFWVKAIKKICIAFFIQELMCEMKGVTNLKKASVVEHEVILISYACSG
jgi:hypothetical protein